MALCNLSAVQNLALLAFKHKCVLQVWRLGSVHRTLKTDNRDDMISGMRIVSGKTKYGKLYERVIYGTYKNWIRGLWEVVANLVCSFFFQKNMF